MIDSESALVESSRASVPLDPSRVRVLNQLTVWQENLIDLTRRNPMLGINRARTTKLQIAAPSRTTLFDALVVDGSSLRLPLVHRRPVSTQVVLFPEEDEPSPWIVREGDLTFVAEPADLYRRLRRIRDNARTTVEERGVTTLHLALGTAHWNDLVLKESAAPLWLVPCAIMNPKADLSPLLVATEEEPQLNPALSIYLRERYNKVLPSLPEEPTSGVIQDLLRQAQLSLGEDFRVTDEAWLSTFSFETLTMHQDLGRLTETAVAHEVVRVFSGA